MDYIAVNELKRPRMIRERLAASEEMLLTSNGRPMAVLLYVDEDDDPEDVLTAARDARSQIALRRIRQRARETGVSDMSQADIDGLIKKARKDRRKHA